MTSTVLNEGVNVPEANVAIVLSGSGSVREHVQRLGRILRKSGDKEAILYEVISRGTAEEFTSNQDASDTVRMMGMNKNDVASIPGICGSGVN